jgi:predicted nucleic acid-binding protein
MTLDDIPAGIDLFLDANILLYYFTRHPVFGLSCGRLLDRIDRGELSGVTSSSVLTEMVHRLMVVEACDLFGWPVQGIVRRLRGHPAEVQQLSRHRQAIDELAAIGFRILPTDGPSVSRTADVTRQTGLLCNDALIVVIMDRNGLTHLASYDSDFDRIPGIIRYAPV